MCKMARESSLKRVTVFERDVRLEVELLLGFKRAVRALEAWRFAALVLAVLDQAVLVLVGAAAVTAHVRRDAGAYKQHVDS